MTVIIRRTGGCSDTIKEELPEEQESLFWAFPLRAALYTALLLTL